MCGIFALFGNDPEPTVCKELWDGAKHFLDLRGPDGNVYHSIIGHGAIAGTRLSIVGESEEIASNVCVTEDGRYYLSFNGEIYNYRRLRKLTPEWNYSCHSDTEVLFALLVTHGFEYTLNVIEGMFAFVLYDTVECKICAAIDEAGQKPLYFRDLKDGWCFSSDIRALLQKSLPPATLSRRELVQTLYFRYVPGIRTLYKEIFKLCPGQKLVCSRAGLDISVYRSVDPQVDYELDPKDAVKRVRSSLIESVEMTLGDSAEIGVFFSGGIDSTAVAAIARELGKDVATFAIGFEDIPGPKFSERWYADEFDFSRPAAKNLGTRHHEYRMSMQKWFDVFRDWSVLQGDPILVLDPVPLMHLSRQASEDFKYVLTGSGADEIFDGYSATELTYASYLASESSNLEEMFENYLILNSRCFGADIRKLFRDGHGWLDSIEALRNSLSCYNLDKYDLFTIGKLLMYRGRRAHYEFAMLDRTGMLYSLEARSPFARRPIAEAAMVIPEALHELGGQPKGVLRQALTGLIPEEIRVREKGPFAMPSSFFFSDYFKELVEPIFHPDSYIISLELVDPAYLKFLWNSKVPGYRSVFPRLVQLELLLKSQAENFIMEP